MKCLNWDRIISVIIAGAGACVNYFFGGWDKVLKTLILLMVLDYLTGLICAGKDKTLRKTWDNLKVYE